MSFLKYLNFMQYEFLKNLFNFNSDNTGNTISSLVGGILQNDLLAPESKSKSFHCLMFNLKNTFNIPLNTYTSNLQFLEIV